MEEIIVIVFDTEQAARQPVNHRPAHGGLRPERHSGL